MAKSSGEPRIGRRRSLATAIVVARMRREQSKYSSVLAFAKKLGISEGTYNLLVSGATKMGLSNAFTQQTRALDVDQHMCDALIGAGGAASILTRQDHC